MGELYVGDSAPPPLITFFFHLPPLSLSLSSLISVYFIYITLITFIYPYLLISNKDKVTIQERCKTFAILVIKVCRLSGTSCIDCLYFCVRVWFTVWGGDEPFAQPHSGFTSLLLLIGTHPGMHGRYGGVPPSKEPEHSFFPCVHPRATPHRLNNPSQMSPYIFFLLTMMFFSVDPVPW